MQVCNVPSLMLLSTRIFLLFACMAVTLPATAHATVTVKLKTSIGDMTLDLYDEAKPVTVTNFLKYIRDGRYNSTFAHRLPPGFVLQGGAYYVEQNQIYNVSTYDPIADEAGPFPQYSNVKGTIAMALSGTGNDTATSSWFINLKNNDGSAGDNLDTLNGGFTVFGNVTSGMNLVDRFAAFTQSDTDGADRIFNTDPGNPLNPLSTLPLKLVVNGHALYENLIYTTWEITGGTKPVITSPATYFVKGKAFSYQIAATGSPMTYAISGDPLPPGVTLDTATGLISGTIADNTAAIINVTASATGASGTGSAPVTIGYNYPVISNGLVLSGTLGKPLQFQIPATNNPTSYAVSELPSGLTLDTTTGVISGKSTVYGTGYVTIYATNAGGTYNTLLYIDIADAVPVVTTKKKVTSSNGTVTIKGTSSAGTKKVEVRPGRGGFRMAKGNPTSWTFTARGMKPGTYKFTIRATKESGKMTITTVTVVVKG